MLYDFPLYDLPLYDFDLTYSESVADSVSTILDHPEILRSWLLEAFPRNADTSTTPPTLLTVQLSTDGHKRYPTDAQHVQFREALTNPYDISVGLDDVLHGHVRSSVGEIEIGDPDGALRYLAREDWQGRQLDVYLGPRGGTQVQFGRVARLTSRDIDTTLDTLRIQADDYGYLFFRPLQTNTYGGTGGLDGDSEITGQLKPVLLGRASRFEPKLVDGTNFIYQLHDGAIESVDGGVEVAGVALAFDADYADITTATPATGEYATGLATGHIKLGAAPDGVVIVRSAEGHNSSVFGYVNDAAGILKLLAVDYAGLATDELDLVAFLQLAVDAPYEIGVYAAQPLDIVDAMNLIHESAHSFGWVKPSKLFTVGRVTNPTAATNYFTLDATRDQVRNDRFDDQSYGIVAWKVVVQYKPYYKVLTDTEVDASVGLATRKDYGEEYRVVTAENAAVLVQTPEARIATFTTTLNVEANAQALADELLSLFSVRGRLVTVSPRAGMIKRGIGDVFELVYDRLPDSPRKMAIISAENSAGGADGADRVIWTAFGLMG